MALILEFKKKPAPESRQVSDVASGTAMIVMFTGVRYERIAAPEAAISAKSAIARKPSGQRRSRPAKVLA